MNKTVDFIILCYNSERFLEKTIDSVLNQTYPHIHLICVNDGSADNTLEILLKYKSEYPNITVIDKLNQGVEAGIKDAIQYLRGDLVFLMGHDDTLSADAIEKAYYAFDSDTSLDAVRVDLYFVDANMNVIRKMADRRKLTGEESFLETLVSWNIHTFCMWRKSIFMKMLEIDMGGQMNYDEIASRYLYYNCRFTSYCTGIYYYLQHSESVTKKFSIKRFDILNSEAFFSEFFNKLPGVSPNMLAKINFQRFNSVLWLLQLYFKNKQILLPEQRADVMRRIKQNYIAINKTQLKPFVSLSKRLVLLTNFNIFSMAAFLKVKLKK